MINIPFLAAFPRAETTATGVDMTKAQGQATTNNVSELIRGTEGFTNARSSIWNPDETVKYEHTYPVDEDGKKIRWDHYTQEHIALVSAIRTGNQIVTAEETAKSNLTAIMGREAAYTGKKVTWEEMMGSDLKLGPEELKLGPVDLKAVIPVPCSAPA